MYFDPVIKNKCALFILFYLLLSFMLDDLVCVCVCVCVKGGRSFLLLLMRHLTGVALKFRCFIRCNDNKGYLSLKKQDANCRVHFWYCCIVGIVFIQDS